MPEKSFKLKTSLVASVASMTLALTGCATIPADAPIAKVDYRACLITTGATDAMGLNEVADYAIKQAVVTYGIKRTVKQTKVSKFVANAEALIAKGCSLLVVSGRDLENSLGDLARAKPEVNFLYIADTAASSLVRANLDNLAVYQIDMYEAGLLAGHLAASMSDSNTVAVLCTKPELANFLSGVRIGIERFDREAKTSTTFKTGPTAGAMSSMRILIGCENETEINALAGYYVHTRVVGFGLDLYENELLAKHKQDIAATVIPKLQPRIMEVIASDLEGDFIGGALGSMVGTYANAGLVISPEHEVAYPITELQKLEQLAVDYEVTLK